MSQPLQNCAIVTATRLGRKCIASENAWPMYTTLIEVAELATAMADPRCAILDCRFELAQPQWGARAYAAGHIPHALYAHLDRDLAGAVRPDSGRHPLPSLAEWAATLSRWGIEGSVQ